jgi:hypothetical protein
MKRSFRPTIETMENRLLLSLSTLAAGPAQIDLASTALHHVHVPVIHHATVHHAQVIHHTKKVVARPKVVAPPAPVTPTIAHPTSPGTYEVINGALFGPSGPSPTDVHQGYTGDCWLDAALAGVAARSPSTITNMFTSLGTSQEGGATVQLYDVRLYTPAGKIVTELVDNEFAVASGPGLPIGIPSDGAAYNNYTTNGVLWAMLAEKAYVQAAASGYVVNSITGTACAMSDSYNDVNGALGNAAWSIQAIAGAPTNVSYTNLSQLTISVLASPGSTIVLGSDANPSSSGLPGSHAFAVIGYNAATGLFTLDNPWNWTYGGLAYPSEFTCNSAFVSQNFDQVAWN